ncbi:MAG: ABC transporter ATP-binding protein [Planctomycetota bacterium]|nr:ABC transporter ATP-binding protein [Planctomycetota bacterium]
MKRYAALTAVDSVNLRIPRGTCYALLGPNGAGKTTLSKMIAAVLPRDGGQMEVLGFDPWIEQSEVKARLGVVMQSEVFDEDLDVRRNLEIYGGFFGLRGAAFQKKIQELLKFVQLEGRDDDAVQALSGGMRRRLMIARALLNDPELLVLDEPTTGLDPQVRHAMWGTLRQLKQRGLTILLTTHYMEEAAQLADRVGILFKGKLIAEDAPRNLISEHLPPWVLEFDASGHEETLVALGAETLAERHGDRAFVFHRDEAALRRWVGEKAFGAAVVRSTSLEDVFLKLTGRTLDE